ARLDPRVRGCFAPPMPPPTPRVTILSVQGLTKTIGSREILKDLSFGIYADAKVGIVGVNGSGKSTLLRILAGEDKDHEGAVVTKLSGGERRRVGLARALLSHPDLLLLDEPTNHLDAATVEWLEHFLTTYHGAWLLVTHDRWFLERSTNQMCELDRGRIFVY